MLDLDSALISAARSAGADLDRLIEAVWPEAFRIAAAILRDRNLAQDAAQDACVHIVRGLPSLKNVVTFRAWAYRIIANAAISIARRTRHMEPLDTTQSMLVANVDVAARVYLWNALRALPLDQRAAVILHYYAGMTSDEIAGGAGLRASTVRFRLMLARRTLHEALKDSSRDFTPSNEGVSHG